MNAGIDSDNSVYRVRNFIIVCGWRRRGYMYIQLWGSWKLIDAQKSMEDCLSSIGNAVRHKQFCSPARITRRMLFLRSCYSARELFPSPCLRHLGYDDLAEKCLDEQHNMLIATANNECDKKKLKADFFHFAASLTHSLRRNFLPTAGDELFSWKKVIFVTKNRVDIDWAHKEGEKCNLITKKFFVHGRKLYFEPFVPRKMNLAVVAKVLSVVTIKLARSSFERVFHADDEFPRKGRRPWVIAKIPSR